MTHDLDLDVDDMLALEAGFEALYRAGDPAQALRLGALALQWRQADELERGAQIADKLFSVRVPEGPLYLIEGGKP